MSKKLIFLAAAALMLVLAGGGGFLFLGGSDGPGEPKAVPTLSRHGYVELDSLAAPVMRGARLTHYVYLALVLEVADPEDTKRVEARRSAVRDAFLRALHRNPMAGDGGGSAPDLEAVKARLLEVAR